MVGDVPRARMSDWISDNHVVIPGPRAARSPQLLNGALLAPRNRGCGVWIPGSPLRGAPE
jgi:hypothetical protein